MKNGNRLSETRNASVLPYTYSPAGSNWLYQKGSDTRLKTANGNTASMSGVGWTYDGYNRAATSTTAAEATTYTYNAFGERIKKINQNGLSTSFHYGLNGELLYERDASGNTRVYVWIDGRPLARIDKKETTYYYHVDHLGTPQTMTDATGTTVWKGDYEPFGKAAVKIGTVENNLRLPGQYFDRETGLHYNYFRDYDPSTGRYIESDPIGLDGGLNLYSYVGGNPISYVDPLGLDKTNWDNRNGGVLQGPTNGNWGGQCWSGGQYSCGQSGVGRKPPTDSAGACYKAHDLGYSSCEPLPNQSACKRICQANNVTMAGRYICEGKCPAENSDTGTEQGCKRPCDQTLVKCLTDLPSNPKNWPMPPRPGTEKDSERFKQWAIDSVK